jgi:hypothetical protein
MTEILREDRIMLRGELKNGNEELLELLKEHRKILSKDFICFFIILLLSCS